MTVRTKILEALGDIDNISDERLCDLLLDAFAEQRKQIEMLKMENAHERERLHDEQESIRRQHERLRSDPLYGAYGTYFFLVNGNRFRIDVQGSRIELVQRLNNIDYRAQQMSRHEWESLK